MPDALDAPTWLLWLIASGAAAAACLYLVKLGGQAVAAVRAARAWRDERFTADVESIIERALVPIVAELHPNHGTSLRDAVDRTEVMVRAHQDDPDAHARTRPVP